ncbi:relaxase/mobilization nuclease RlxS [soil metagenome]
MTGHQDSDLPEFRPPMTVGRDGAYPTRAWPSLAGGMSGASHALTPRARARYFSSRNTQPHLRALSSTTGVGRRVVVKILAVRGGAASRLPLLNHLQYVRRGMEEEPNQPAALFDRDADRADTLAFSTDCASDRWHYRLIVNPEDGRDLPDLRAFGRTLMGQMEQDLETRMCWIAADHYDTGRPHLHIFLRGRRDDGTTLSLGQEYVREGLRGRAEEIVTATLGLGRPRFSTPSAEIVADRFTNLDLTIIQTAENGRASLSQIPEAMRSDVSRRLVHLEAGNWISRHSDGAWVLPSDLRERLSDFGEQEARERVAATVLSTSSWPAQPGRLERLTLGPGQRATGAYVGCGRFGRFAYGPQVLVLDLEDGRLAHFRLPTLNHVMCLDRVPEGAVVQIYGSERTGRRADQTIAEVAAAQGGVYSLAHHKAERPKDGITFIASHLKRLKAMGREGVCDPLQDGRFAIPPDYQARAMVVDQVRDGAATLTVRVLDARPFQEQVVARAPTYLDTLMSKRTGTDLQGAFGDKAAAAIDQRVAVLRGWGLGGGRPFALSAEEKKVLGVMEVQSVFERLGEGGKPVFLATNSEPFTGVYMSRVHVGSRPYAVFEARNAITLAPWRAGLEAFRGRELAGQVTAAVLDFRAMPIARGAGLEL